MDRDDQPDAIGYYETRVECEVHPIANLQLSITWPPVPVKARIRNQSEDRHKTFGSPAFNGGTQPSIGTTPGSPRAIALTCFAVAF